MINHDFTERGKWNDTADGGRCTGVLTRTLKNPGETVTRMTMTGAAELAVERRGLFSPRIIVDDGGLPTCG